jgi:hypothetical protein
MSQQLFDLLLQEKEPSKSVMISFRASCELVTKLEAVSKRINQPKSKVMKLILEKGIDELEKDLDLRGFPRIQEELLMQ